MWAALARLGSGMMARGGATAARGAAAGARGATAAEGGAGSTNKIGRLSQQFGGGGGNNRRNNSGFSLPSMNSSFEQNPTGAEFYGHGG